jgi:hypothetical protein
MTINRRDMLKATAAAVALPAVLGKCAPGAGEAGGAGGAGGAPKFFTAAEFALVDELSDMIIPTDAQSKGARAAGVAAYIDARMAEAFDAPPENGRPPEKERWRAGLKAVEALSSEMNGKAFMESTSEQRLAVLTKMAAAESDPKTDAEKFFKEIKGSTIGAYYTSNIGIHDDQKYKGNVVQTGEYAGFDAT